MKNGGILITTFMSGIVGQSDNVYLGGYPGSLREMAGVWVEEIDALAPEQKNKAKFADGSTAACGLLCDLMQSRRPEFHPLSRKKPDLKLSHASVIPRDSILS